VRRWVKGYQQHGVQGLRKKYSHYDAQFKLGVLRKMWAEELSCRQASTLLDVRGGHNVVST
jgi:transposase